jgi:hypothetical protein
LFSPFSSGSLRFSFLVSFFLFKVENYLNLKNENCLIFKKNQVRKLFISKIC